MCADDSIKLTYNGRLCNTCIDSCVIECKVNSYAMCWLTTTRKELTVNAKLCNTSIDGHMIECPVKSCATRVRMTALS